MSPRFAGSSLVTALACLAPGLGGCAGATPGAQAPIEVAVVSLDAAQAKTANGKPKAEEGKMGAPDKKPLDPAAARKQALEDAVEYGMVGLLNAGDGSVFSGLLGGVPGGVVGGVVGGPNGGGGFGLSGTGTGGGGSGGTIGFGSIGRGGGGGSGSISGIGSYSGSSVAGQSVLVSGNMVIELGDAVALGVSIEAATSTMRSRMSAMRGCYAKALGKNRALAGSVALRLVVGKDGRVALARDLGSDLGDPEAITCLLDTMKDAYVGYAGAAFFGVVETTVRFSTKK